MNIARLALIPLGLAVSTPALAVKYGDLDGEAHPYVGLMVADDADGRPMWRCTGTLISPTLFLTAGHCTSGAARATIWFESDVDAGRPANGYPFGGPTSHDGTPHTHPSFDDAAFYLYDLGVVVLDEPVSMPTYGALPDVGQVDALLSATGPKPTLRAVGYGLQYVIDGNPHDGADVFLTAEKKRYTAVLDIIGTQGVFGMPAGSSLKMSNNANTGGTCFGDSGGPEFITGTNIVAGVTSFGMNGNCAGTGGVYRVDTDDDLDWLYTEFGDLLP